MGKVPLQRKPEYLCASPILWKLFLSDSWPQRRVAKFCTLNIRRTDVWMGTDFVLQEASPVKFLPSRI